MKNIILLASLLATSCASITTGSNQSLSVETPEAEGAKCTLNNDKGTWYVSGTPGSVTVHRSYSDLNVTCKKDGYAKATQSFKSSTKGMAAGNIIFGGIIGGAVDVGTGAAYDYPPLISLPMEKNKKLSSRE